MAEPVDAPGCVPYRRPDGRICAPACAVAPDGTLGDALVYLSPDDEAFAVWDEYLRKRDRFRAET